jgi:hypothetical protein
VDPALRRLVESGDGEDEVAVMVRLAEPSTPLPADVRVVSAFDDIVTVRLPRSGVEALHDLQPVRSVKAAKRYRPELVRVDAEAVEATDDDLRRPAGLDATGRGVLVGVVDWGLDFRHPAFLGPDGRTRLEALWDQAAADDPARPNRFGYGRIHFRQAIDAALARDDPFAALGHDPAAWDVGGGAHGTATASVAVGSAWPGGVEGVAPGAALAFVSLVGGGPLGHSVSIGEAVDFIRELAGERPWVVNMSLGRHGGPHDGSTLLEQLLDNAVDAPGGMVVNSAGNYWSSDVHTTARLATGEVMRIPLRVAEAIRDVHEIDVWYRGVDRLAVGLVAPDGSATALARPESDVRLTLGDRQVARVQHRADDPNNGRNQAVVRIEPDAPPGVWQVVLAGADVVDGRFHAWIEREALNPHTQARFAGEDAVETTTTGTICNGLRNLAVGAYDHHRPGWPLTRFSSSGDTVDGRAKPNLLAPGERVLVARSRPPGVGADDAPLSTRMSGTSMAAPAVTGTLACLMELTGRVPASRLRLALLESARPYEGEETVRAGNGYLDVAAAVAAAGARRPGAARAPSRRARARGESETTEAPMTTIPTALAEPGALPQPDDVLRGLGTTARGLFDVYVMNRREDVRERLAGRLEVAAAPGDAAGTLQAGDLLVRGAMGEGRAWLSVLVSGELHDLRAARGEGFELEGSLPGRYAWVVEGGSAPRPREDRFARRVADPRGYLPLDQVVLRPLAAAAPAPAPAAPEWQPEWEPEAVNRQSPAYIRWYQAELNRIDSAGLAVDGINGPLTRAAVRRYQARKGLAADGIVGPITERALMQDGAAPPPGWTGPVPAPAPPSTWQPIPWLPPIPIPQIPPVPAATTVRERKNVTALTTAERAALVAAIQALKTAGGYNQFITDHAASMDNAHRQPAFLPWHRKFLLIFESELRAIDPTVTLPYWDWSNDPGVVSAAALWNSAMVSTMGGGSPAVGSPVTGPFTTWRVVNAAGTVTSAPLERHFGNGGRVLPAAAEVTRVLRVTPYDAAPWNRDPATTAFRNDFEGWSAPRNHLHNEVHMWIGGQMALADISPNDPAFWLHHCFIDKVWADWQAAHPSEDYLPATTVTRPAGGPAWGKNDSVPVFRVGGSTPVTYRAADVLSLTNLSDHLGATGITVRYL